MELSGLVLRRNEGSGCYDRFRHRLIFPIHSESGKVIAFGGRALDADDQPKYLNSPETSLYRKGDVLYKPQPRPQGHPRRRLHHPRRGLHGRDRGLRRRHPECCGHLRHRPHAIPGLGPAPPCYRACRQFRPDKAGRSATEKSIDVLLTEHMQVRVLELPEGVDPDEYILDHSAEAYADLVKNQTRRYFHWLAERARGKFDVRTPEGRVAIFQFLLPQIHKMPDRIDRLQVVDDVAEYLKIDAGIVRDEFRKAASERREPRPLPPPVSPFKPHEQRLLRALLESPRAVPNWPAASAPSRPWPVSSPPASSKSCSE